MSLCPVLVSPLFIDSEMLKKAFLLNDEREGTGEEEEEKGTKERSFQTTRLKHERTSG